eukprot:294446-Alexandrium_andersonii.AAC.1
MVCSIEFVSSNSPPRILKYFKHHMLSALWHVALRILSEREGSRGAVQHAAFAALASRGQSVAQCWAQHLQADTCFGCTRPSMQLFLECQRSPAAVTKMSLGKSLLSRSCAALRCLGITPGAAGRCPEGSIGGKTVECTSCASTLL